MGFHRIGVGIGPAPAIETLDETPKAEDKAPDPDVDTVPVQSLDKAKPKKQ